MTTQLSVTSILLQYVYMHIIAMKLFAAADAHIYTCKCVQPLKSNILQRLFILFYFFFLFFYVIHTQKTLWFAHAWWRRHRLRCSWTLFAEDLAIFSSVTPSSISRRFEKFNLGSPNYAKFCMNSLEIA